MTMMTTLFAGALALLSVQNATTETVLKEVQQEIQKGGLQNKTEEQVNAWLDGFAKKIDMSTLTLKDAHQITGSVLIYSPAMQDMLSTRLNEIKTTSELEKTMVMAFRVDLASHRSEVDLTQVTTLAESAMKSPGAKALMASPDGSILVDTAMATLSNKSEGVLKPFFQLVNEPVTAATAQSLIYFWLEYVDSGNKTDFDARHKAVLGAVDRALKGLKDEDERWRSQLEEGLKKLDSPFAKGQLLNSVAPEINFLWLSSGKEQKLSDFRGQVVVIDFWATWCGPCVASFPKIAEVVKHYEGKPVKFIGVTSVQGMMMMEGVPVETRDLAHEVELMPKYMKEKSITWPIAISKEDVFNADYGVQGIPNMVIIDKEGVVRHIGINPLSLSFEAKKALIDPLLK